MQKKGNSLILGVLLVLGILFFLALLIGAWLIGTYNSLVQIDTSTENSWAKVQTAYERRADLIPNLVETVKGSVKFEKETQTEIARLRSGIKNAKTPDQIDKAGREMNSFISDIIINVEAYPDLKSNQNFISLQDELAGTENRIKWERDNYNDAVAKYKVAVKRFPSNLISGMFGFEQSKWNMFQAEEGSENPVKVGF